MKNITRKLIHIFVTGYFIFSQSSCKKFIEVPAPSTSTNKDIVYSTDAAAIATLTGIYTSMSQSGIYSGLTGISYFAGLSSDELMLYNGVTSTDLLAFYKNSLTTSYGAASTLWSNSYNLIFKANSAIEGISSSSTLSPAVKQQLLGEAKFIRAFCYFYLVNLYGDVPLVLTPDYKQNSNIPRAPMQNVYNRIIIDLKDAQLMLNNDYLNVTFSATSSERTTPNKWVATALLARTYLYLKDYPNAIVQATAVIDHSDVYDLVSLEKVFLKNNKEAIWQIQSVSDVFSNTFEARLFILPTNGPNTSNSPAYLFRDFENIFEANDGRKSSWLGSALSTNGTRYYYPYKYKVNGLFAPSTEYTVVLRLAELYLIRAEAYAQQSNLENAKNDLNKIRARAGAVPIASTDQSTMITSIMTERRKEFFTEWGHRWLDLKRIGIIDDVMPGIMLKKGGIWEPFKQLYPIPQSEIERNPALAGQQNPGYN